LGWRLDDGVAALDGLRIVQFTPPGSRASITFGKGLTTAAPGFTQGALVVSAWRTSLGNGRTVAVGLYRADSERELKGLLCSLPLAKWLPTSITSLLQHPNDPAVSEGWSR
jgi:muconolactone delta-isomerase